MATVQEIQRDLQGLYPQVFGASAKREDREMLQSCSTVASFLTSPRASEMLVEINRKMCMRSGADVEATKGYYGGLYSAYLRKVAVKNAVDAKKEPRHVLSAVMASEETLAGFGQIKGNENTETLLAFSKDSDAFRRRISLGRTMKDPSVGGMHGEHTHRLQWTMISLAKIVDNPAALYKFIGTVPFEKDPKRGLWDSICDRDNGKNFSGDVNFQSTEKTDFRCPETLIEYIVDVNNGKQFELLHIYVRARLEKRRYQANKAVGQQFDKKAYASQKIFGKPAYELDDKQRLALAEVLARDVITPEDLASADR